MATLMAWLFGSMVPLIASIMLVIVYYRRWQDIRQSPGVPLNEPVRIPAYGNLRREVTRIMGNSCFVIAGFWALGKRLYPDLFPDDQGMTTVFLLLAGQYLIGSNSVTDWIDQLRLDRAVEKWNQEYVPIEKDQADELEACMEQLRRQDRREIGG